MTDTAHDLFWCNEECGFVEENHRCEQWCQLTRIPAKAVEALQLWTTATTSLTHSGLHTNWSTDNHLSWKQRYEKLLAERNKE